MFALCDCNNFYASAERLFRPGLRELPIVVLSNNDGCVIARSNEAKACGIKMGDPAFLVKDLIKKYNIQVFSSNYVLYGDLSQRVMQNLSRWFPKLEVYSIDEAFGWLEGVKELQSYIPKARESVVRNTGIPVSIGVAPTRTLAKVANKLAKKGNGTFIMDTPERITAAITDFPLDDLWGVGKQYYKKLEAMGIETVGQLRELPEMWFKQHMTVQGQRMYNELWGIPAIGISDKPVLTKGVSVSRSFRNYVETTEMLCEAVAMYTSRLAEKLRNEKMCCLNLEVFLYTNKHREDHPQHYPSHTHRLAVASNDTTVLVPIANRTAGMLFQPGIKYRKAGVVATGLIPEHELQFNLFEEAPKKSKGLSAVIDHLNMAYGRGTIRMASEGYEKKWKLRHEYLSKGYTTRWEDIVKVK